MCDYRQSIALQMHHPFVPSLTLLSSLERIDGAQTCRLLFSFQMASQPTALAADLFGRGWYWSETVVGGEGLLFTTRRDVFAGDTAGGMVSLAEPTQQLVSNIL